MTTTRSIPYDRCPPLQRDSQPSRERQDRGDCAPMSGYRNFEEQRRTSQNTFRMKQVPQLLMIYMQSSVFCFLWPSLSLFRLLCLHLPILFIFGASLHQIPNLSLRLSLTFAHFLSQRKIEFQHEFLINIFERLVMILLSNKINSLTL